MEMKDNIGMALVVLYGLGVIVLANGPGEVKL
jgi:hypothetical protein